MYRIVCKSEEEARRVAAGVYMGVKAMREQVVAVMVVDDDEELGTPRIFVDEEHGEWFVEIEDDGGEVTEYTIEEAVDRMAQEQED